ncbi:hypothetical protein BC943DRAFT_356318 [Umbelopsis sp. AD052]|nr:hypothetical protein BC943DRAFT_356318 [Umbelopsis sp. AD052]
MAGLGVTWSMMDPTMRLSRDKPNMQLPVLDIPKLDEDDIKLALSSPVMPSSPSFFNTTFDAWPSNSPESSVMISSPKSGELDPIEQPKKGNDTPPVPKRSKKRNAKKAAAGANGMDNTDASESEANGSNTSAIESSSDNSASKHLSPPKRANSLQVGNHVRNLLNAEEVQGAVHMLQEAAKHLDMSEIGNEDPQELASTYSKILLTLCDQKILELVMDICKCDDIIDSIIWKLFSKVIAAGYTMDNEVYTTLANLFVQYNHVDLAQQAIYSLPRQQWDTEIYKIAITLHLLAQPRELLQIETLLSDYGEPSIEVLNPIAPTKLPPIRIDTPLMNDVTVDDKKVLFSFYQTALDSSGWGRAKEIYETDYAERQGRRQSIAAEQPMTRRKGVIDWLISGTEKMMIHSKDSEKNAIEEVQNDNSMLYIAICNLQYEYGWKLFESMGKNVDRHTGRMMMRLCRCAFNAAPVTNVSNRFNWEQRAWRVYAVFMMSEYFDVQREESHAFLRDILFICANSTEREDNIRYSKAMQILKLLRREKLYQMIGDEYVMMPIFCILLEQCHGVPDVVVTQCEAAFSLWKEMQEANMNHLKEVQPPSQSFCWMMLLFIFLSGKMANFRDVLVWMQDMEPSESLVAPIQYLHDAFLNCKIPDDSRCYFSDYMYHDTTIGTDAVAQEPDGHHISINEMGFKQGNIACYNEREGPTYGDPIAHVKNAYKMRSTISDTNAVHVAKFAALGPLVEVLLEYRTMHYSSRKAKALIRHCFMASKK